MQQQLWGYKVEWKSVSRGTGRKKVEYYWFMPSSSSSSSSSRISPLGLFRFRILFFETYEFIGQLVGLLGRGIGPMQGLYLHRTTQHRKTWTHIHASSRIRTHDPSVRAAEDSTCLRPLGHWDQRVVYVTVGISGITRSKLEDKLKMCKSVRRLRSVRIERRVSVCLISFHPSIPPYRQVSLFCF
jgi:hypothetical protein